MERLKVRLKGAVQGVGFRPFVYRVARELGLKGFVLNDSGGVEIEVEGERSKLEEFLVRLNRDKPPLAHIYSQDLEFLPSVGYEDFEIKESRGEGEREVSVLPDIATCDECLKELFELNDRRYMYPFINCTNCGPRFTIVEALPYDRPNTSMKKFSMCKECLREYRDPMDRRFHAQPNACPVCGPQVKLLSSKGKEIARGREALKALVEKLTKGRICAVKGVGGFHLMCNATDEEAVRELRERKRRQEKPFAVMFKDLGQMKEFALPTKLEEALLLSPERPIVLIDKKKELAPSVAPGLKKVGAFLPYSPLHHIILRELSFPLVATSGNLSNEPIVKDNDEALEKLSPFCDYLLVHNRDIVRRCDDSVVKVIAKIPTPIRRSRGYAPLPIKLGFPLEKRILAVGGMLKNTFAIGSQERVILSQHVGDINNLSNLEAFEEAVHDLLKLYQFEPQLVVCDMHPRYETSRWAQEFSRQRGIPLIKVQHHYAHVLSCMAENGIKEKVLGIAWDGTGYGEDGTLWGGEFLIADYQSYIRAYHIKPFKLIGGERAVKEPKRVAISILFHIYGKDAFGVVEERIKGLSEKEVELLYKAWSGNVNSPLSSSVGRLFDAVASLLGLKQVLSYEGQAAIMLEDRFDGSVNEAYPFEIEGRQINWVPTFLALLSDKEVEKIPSRFINTLARISLSVAREVGIQKVCLSGGVMQNAPLVEKIKERLQAEGFEVYTHRSVPPNDGGISLGQAVYRNVQSL